MYESKESNITFNYRLSLLLRRTFIALQENMILTTMKIFKLDSTQIYLDGKGPEKKEPVNMSVRIYSNDYWGEFYFTIKYK